VLDAAAEVASVLLSSCPDVRVLATSQIRLTAPGEATWPVPPLGVPEPGADGLDEIAASESVRLLCDRAARSRPGFELTAADAVAAASVCRRLDGIPLAIELAAARLNALTIRQLAARLDDRFALLTGGSRAALPRHRALVAAIEWSYDLLSPAEQVCLGRLAVFAGGCTIEAAEAVCADGQLAVGEVLDAVTSLVSKSLLTAREQAGAMRYGMLESVRMYAGRLLDKAGEWPAVRRRHQAWLLDLLGQGESGSLGLTAWLDLIQADLDNVMTGLEHALDERSAGHDPAVALALAAGLAQFWLVRGPAGLGRRWLATALAAAGPGADPRLRATALDGAGLLAGEQADLDAQFACQQQSLAIWRELGDDAKIASCLGELGSVAHLRNEFAAAEALYAEALEVAGRAGNDDRLIGRCLSGFGRLAFFRNDMASASAYYEESMARFRAAGELRRTATILGNLGLVAFHQDDIELARARLTEYLAQARRLADRKLIGGALTNLGLVLTVAGELDEAASLHRQALELGEELENPRLLSAALQNLGIVSLVRGDHAEAMLFHQRSLTLAADVGEPRAIAECVEGLATVEAAAGRPERAARLLGVADQLRAEVGSPVLSGDAGRVAAAAVQAEAALGAAGYAAARAAGAAMTLAEAIEFAGVNTADRAPDPAAAVAPAPAP
jgi:predicted ATPase